MKRLIARLDIKSEFLIKGIRFEGLKKIGDPVEAASQYYDDGVDELLLVDTVASLFGRNHLGSILENVAKRAFVPLTAAGGIRSLRDAEELFGLGADKVAVNTASFANPKLISEIANKFGAQAVVGSVHAKRGLDDWECLTEQGRERTGITVKNRIHHLIDMGAGEILITSVDNDGVQGGFDIPPAEMACETSTVPITIGGGAGVGQDILDLMGLDRLSGVAIGSLLHFDTLSVRDLKAILQNNEHRQGAHSAD